MNSDTSPVPAPITDVTYAISFRVLGLSDYMCYIEVTARDIEQAKVKLSIAIPNATIYSIKGISGY